MYESDQQVSYLPTQSFFLSNSMEYMDAGSLDKLSVIPVPEPVLQRVTASMVRGLKFLKDALQIMHRGE